MNNLLPLLVVWVFDFQKTLCAGWRPRTSRELRINKISGDPTVHLKLNVEFSVCMCFSSSVAFSRVLEES